MFIFVAISSIAVEVLMLTFVRVPSSLDASLSTSALQTSFDKNHSFLMAATSSDILKSSHAM